MNQTEAALAAAAALVRLDPHSEDSRGVAKFYQKAGKPLDQQMLSEVCTSWAVFECVSVLNPGHEYSVIKG